MPFKFLVKRLTHHKSTPALVYTGVSSAQATGGVTSQTARPGSLLSAEDESDADHHDQQDRRWGVIFTPEVLDDLMRRACGGFSTELSDDRRSEEQGNPRTVDVGEVAGITLTGDSGVASGSGTPNVTDKSLLPASPSTSNEDTQGVAETEIQSLIGKDGFVFPFAMAQDAATATAVRARQPVESIVEDTAQETEQARSSTTDSQQSPDAVTEPSSPKRLTYEERDNIHHKAEALERRVKELELVVNKQATVISDMLADFRARRNANDDPTTEASAFVRHYIEMKKARDLVESLDAVRMRRGIFLLKALQAQKSAGTQPAKSTPQTKYLDTPLTTAAALKSVKSMDMSLFASAGARTDGGHRNDVNFSVRVCAACNMTKFVNAPFHQSSSSRVSPRSNGRTDGNNSNTSVISEFHATLGTTPCCGSDICNECLLASLVRGITDDWWDDLVGGAAARRGGGPYGAWLPGSCPVRGDRCRWGQTAGTAEPLCVFRYNVQLARVLRELADPDVHRHTMLFERANRLRSALRVAVMPPSAPPGVTLSEEAVALSKKIHAAMMATGLMRDFFDVRGEQPNFKVEMLAVDSPDSGRSIMVPIFTGLLRRSEKAQDCSICAETFHEFVGLEAQVPGVGDSSVLSETTPAEAWKRIVTHFPGDWTHSLHVFPTPDLLPVCASRHELDICRNCLARHVATSLELRGRAGAAELTCPVVKCRARFDEPEVVRRIAGSNETFELWSRYRLLAHLATLPGFRWCLREGCGNGEVYEMPPSPTLLEEDDSGGPLRDEADGGGSADLQTRHLDSPPSFAGLPNPAGRLAATLLSGNPPGFVSLFERRRGNVPVAHGRPRLVNVGRPSWATTSSNANNDDLLAALRKRITCSKCNFQMCFSHQTAWHEGYTCAGWDAHQRQQERERATGEAETKRWITANTKSCPGPGCGVPLEKKGGCFHMTCTVCKYEFCWLCLADWKAIVGRREAGQTGMYRREAHKKGCWFREPGRPMPTAVTGNGIEDLADQAHLVVPDGL